MGAPQAAVVVVVLVQKREVLDDERGRALVVVLIGRAEVMLTGLDQAGVALDESVEVVLCEQDEVVLLVVLTQRGDVVLVVSGTAVTTTTEVEVEVTGMVVVVERVVLAQKRDVVLVVAGTAVTMTTEVEVEVTETVAEVESVLFLERVWLGRGPFDWDGERGAYPYAVTRPEVGADVQSVASGMSRRALFIQTVSVSTTSLIWTVGEAVVVVETGIGPSMPAMAETVTSTCSVTVVPTVTGAASSSLARPEPMLSRLLATVGS